ncbi:MAG: hypothetical protein SVR81_07375 [Chloroflexota bacterium]|nr:hypothetical protein [Chloroflexota bacterium]
MKNPIRDYLIEKGYPVKDFAEDVVELFMTLWTQKYPQDECQLNRALLNNKTRFAIPGFII